MARIALTTLLAIFVFAAPIQAADFEATACRSGEMTVVQGSQELMILGVELNGVVRRNTEMLNDVSEICVGNYKKMGDDVSQSGYCKYLYTNGDINVLEWEGSRNEGDWRYLMGTGKWQGIKGGGKWNNLMRAKSIAEGTFQNCIVIKGAYELPK